MTTSSLRWQRCAAGQLLADTRLAQAWDSLNAVRHDLPFLDSRVVGAALRIFGEGNEQLVYASVDSRICAMFVLRPQGRWRWCSFQPSQLPLGAWVSDGRSSLGELAASMQAKVLSPCLALTITQIDPLLEPLPPASTRSETLDYVETGWIALEGDFDTYWALRGKNLRQNMRKQRNRLEADGVQPLMLEHRTQEAMDGCIGRYGDIESKGWKAQEGTAIHPDNSQGRFYTEVFRTMAQTDEAAVYEYRFDSKPVAMDLCLQRRDLLVILKTTYDESIKHASPAFLLRQDEMQALFQQGSVRRIEFYGKFMEWHSRWTEDKRMLYHFTHFRWAWLMRMAQARRLRAHRAGSVPSNMTQSNDES